MSSPPVDHRALLEQIRLLGVASAETNAGLSSEEIARSIADHARRIFDVRAVVVSLAPFGTHAEIRTISLAEGATPDEIAAVDLTPADGGLVETLPASDGGAVGTIRLVGRAQRDFSEADPLLLAQLARMAAVAIGNARLQESAKIATRVRDDMMSVVSHDLRNPLNTILLSAEILARRQGDKQVDAVPIALRIRRSAERMNTLIGDLVDVTRIESKVLRVELQTESVAAIADDVFDVFRQAASEKSIALQTEIAKDLSVRADRGRIAQTLGNLIGNSLKVTPGGGAITISAEADGDDVKICVADTGSGISPDKLPKLFERYWLTQGKMKQGSGLGLFIARGIVEAHGGRMWAESDENGARFSFTLAKGTRSSSPV